MKNSTAQRANPSRKPRAATSDAVAPTAEECNERYNQARIAQEKAVKVIGVIDDIREQLERFYAGFATHLEAHDDEPDIEAKCDFAELVLSLNNIRTDVGFVHVYVTERVKAAALAGGAS